MPEELPSSMQELGSQLRAEVFRHTSRVVILLSLGTNKHLWFSQLVKLTGLSKGSLGHHLHQLEAAGFVSAREVFTVSGPRVRISITPAGKEAFDRLSGILARLARDEIPPSRIPGPAAGLST